MDVGWNCYIGHCMSVPTGKPKGVWAKLRRVTLHLHYTGTLPKKPNIMPGGQFQL